MRYSGLTLTSIFRRPQDENPAPRRGPRTQSGTVQPQLPPRRHCCSRHLFHPRHVAVVHLLFLPLRPPAPQCSQLLLIRQVPACERYLPRQAFPDQDGRDLPSRVANREPLIMLYFSLCLFPSYALLIALSPTRAGSVTVISRLYYSPRNL